MLQSKRGTLEKDNIQNVAPERKREWIVFIFVFVLTSVTLIGAALFSEKTRVRRVRAEAEMFLADTMDTFEEVLGDGIRETQILKAWLLTSGKDYLGEIAEHADGGPWAEDFNRLAEAFYDEDSMYTVGILPDGKVGAMYPLPTPLGEDRTELREKDIYTIDPDWSASLTKAVSEDSPAILEPVVNGEKTGYLIYIVDPVINDGGSLWGFTQVVLKIPDSLQKTWVKRLEENGFQYQLYFKKKSGAVKRIATTFSEKNQQATNAISLKRTIRDTEWVLKVMPADDWTNPGKMLGGMALLVLGALLFALLLQALKWRRDSRVASLRSDASRDQMTKLLNHESVTNAVNALVENREDGVLFMIDIDNFKTFNDTSGHQAGDMVIMAVADALKRTFRREDILGRYGGDEFVAYMIGDVSKPDYAAKADNLSRRLRAIKVPGVSRDITCSIGIAKLSDRQTTGKALFAAADSALYESKNNGKDQFTIYE